MIISTQNGFRLMTRFEKAVRAHDNMGAMPPEDHAEIERKYENAKKALKDFIIQSVIIEG